jgi:hypothetical protein
MEHVESIKSKGRAAGPKDAEFQRLYHPAQARKVVRPRAEEQVVPSSFTHPRPRSAPRPKSSARLSDETDQDVGQEPMAEIGQHPRTSFTEIPRRSSAQGRSQSVPRSRASRQVDPQCYSGELD